MKNIKLFLSVLLICVSFSASSQVVSIGSLDEVKDVQRFRFEADFSEAIIHGLSVSDFAIYEPDWDKDYDEILDACGKSFGMQLNDKYKTQQEIQRLLRY